MFFIKFICLNKTGRNSLTLTLSYSSYQPNGISKTFRRHQIHLCKYSYPKIDSVGAVVCFEFSNTKSRVNTRLERRRSKHETSL